MKTTTYFIGFLVMALVVSFCTSCVQKGNETSDIGKIENTLKSVSLLYDSIGIDPSKMFLSLERVNKAIDSIGYPDAGYKLWLVQSDTNKNFRFMLEGYWPNQAIYDTIHNHELYKNANNNAPASENEMWKALKNVSYNRFTLVK